MKAILVLLAMTTTTLVAPSAFAVDKEAARRAYEEGRRRYDLNEFGAALDAFKRAYLSFEDPVFLFNIAQCHRQLGHKEDAVKFYRSYLRNVPDAPNADEVKAIAARLQAEVDAQREEDARAAAAAATAASKPAAPEARPVSTAITATAPIEPRTPVYKKWWLWTAVGVVAAGAATAIALSITSQRTENSFAPVTVGQ